MRLKLDCWIDADDITCERFITAEPKVRWKMMGLMIANRPQSVSFSEPIIQKEPIAPPTEPTGN